MKRELLVTSDGSHTIFLPHLQVTYHSIHGAMQESRHIFIKAGFEYILSKFPGTGNDSHCIFEMGFGTGLNALLSFEKAKQENVHVYYFSAELHPLSSEEFRQLNYLSILNDDALSEPFGLMHECRWNEDVAISPFFTLHKSAAPVHYISPAQPFHLIYFDAFAPDIQPELWTLSVFQQMYNMLCSGGALVTYSSKGSVRRAMQEAGFIVEKLKGPPGKREIIRAVKSGDKNDKA